MYKIVYDLSKNLFSCLFYTFHAINELVEWVRATPEEGKRGRKGQARKRTEWQSRKSKDVRVPTI